MSTGSRTYPGTQWTLGTPPPLRNPSFWRDHAHQTKRKRVRSRPAAQSNTCCATFSGAPTYWASDTGNRPFLILLFLLKQQQHSFLTSAVASFIYFISEYGGSKLGLVRDVLLGCCIHGIGDHDLELEIILRTTVFFLSTDAKGRSRGAIVGFIGSAGIVMVDAEGHLRDWGFESEKWIVNRDACSRVYFKEGDWDRSNELSDVRILVLLKLLDYKGYFSVLNDRVRKMSDIMLP